MVDATKLKARIIKNLSIFPFEDIVSTSEEIKFVLRFTPFKNSPNFVVVIEYITKHDILRITATVGVGTKLIDDYKKKSDPEKNEINNLFAKPIKARDFNIVIAPDFSSVSGYKFLIQQNFNPQQLLEMVNEATFLLQALGATFVEADNSLKIPEATEASMNMFG